MTKIGDTFPIPHRKDKVVSALEKRDGSNCIYCKQPVSRFYNRVTGTEFHATDWSSPWGGDQRAGLYPIYESFLPEGHKAIQIDHKIPRAKGGKNKLDNYVLSCPECNLKKSDRYSHEEFMAMCQTGQAL